MALTGTDLALYGLTFAGAYGGYAFGAQTRKGRASLIVGLSALTVQILRTQAPKGDA